MGLIIGTSGQPRFKTKSIVHAYPLPALPLHLIKLSQWLQTYYPAPLGIIGQQLMPAQLAAKQIAHQPEQQFTAPDLTALPPLTTEQRAALAAIDAADTLSSARQNRQRQNPPLYRTRRPRRGDRQIGHHPDSRDQPDFPTGQKFPGGVWRPRHRTALPASPQ